MDCPGIEPASACAMTRHVKLQVPPLFASVPKPISYTQYLDNVGYSKANVKCTLVQTLRLCTGRTAHRGSRGIALPFHYHALEGGEGSASRPSRSLSPGKTRYQLYRRLGGTQGRSGQVRKITPPPGFNPRTVQPVASRYTD